MTGPVRVRPTKLVPLQAWQVTTANVAEVARWCGGSLLDDGTIMIKRPGGDDWVCEFAEVDDWVVDPDREAGTATVLSDFLFQKHYQVIEP